MSDTNRTAVYRIVSDMLDHPDDSGIYPTTKCYNALEALLDAKDSELAAYQNAEMPEAPKIYKFDGNENDYVLAYSYDALAKRCARQAVDNALLNSKLIALAEINARQAVELEAARKDAEFWRAFMKQAEAVYTGGYAGTNAVMPIGAALAAGKEKEE